MESGYILDYCNRNNSAIFINDSEDHSEIFHCCDVSCYKTYPFTDNQSFSISTVDKITTSFGEESQIEFLIIVTRTSCDNMCNHLREQGFVVISTTPSHSSLDVSEECLISYISAWNAYLYCKTPQNLPEPLRGSDGPDTFTGITMTNRIPEIIYQTQSSIPDLSPEGNALYKKLSDDIRTNKPLCYFCEDMSSLNDTLFYSKVEHAIHHHTTWHTIPWWLAENYQFRCMNHIQNRCGDSIKFKDPFYYLKREGLMAAITILPELVHTLINDAKSSGKMEYSLFHLTILRNLWGNKADLSMSGGKVDRTEVRSEASNLLLIDQCEETWEYLTLRKLSNICIVADNTGLECLCDFVLIAILLNSFDSLSITYVVKSDPVFVSDVTMPDIEPSLNALKTQSDSNLRWVYDVITMGVAEGRVSFIPMTFLITASPGWNMPLSMMQLLEKQDLMIVKGDANYRRLAGDLRWSYDTPLNDVIGYLPCATLLLRTLKSQVSLGISEDLQKKAMNFDKKWDCSGKVGIIQFNIPSH